MGINILTARHLHYDVDVYDNVMYMILFLKYAAFAKRDNEMTPKLVFPYHLNISILIILFLTIIKFGFNYVDVNYNVCIYNVVLGQHYTYEYVKLASKCLYRLDILALSLV